jgi:glutamate/aspartate transport system substrate-binding protein
VLVFGPSWVAAEEPPVFIWDSGDWCPKYSYVLRMLSDAMTRHAVAAFLCVVISAMGAGAQPLEGRLKTIHDTATLRIAHRTDSRPFSFLNAQGQPVGYTIELCERVAISLEHELALPSLAIRWVQVDTQTRFAAVSDGLADMECGSSSVSLSRMKVVDFSSLVFADSTGLVVRTDSGVHSFEAMAGRRIAIIPGSTNAQAIRDQLERRKLAATLVELGDREDGFAALVQGTVDGFATDKLVLRAMMRRANSRELALLPEDLSFEPFAIVLPRGDWAFRLAVNASLAQTFRSGEVLQIYNKYFGDLGFHPSGWLGAVFTFGSLPQ